VYSIAFRSNRTPNPLILTYTHPAFRYPVFGSNSPTSGFIRSPHHRQYSCSGPSRPSLVSPIFRQPRTGSRPRSLSHAVLPVITCGVGSGTSVIIGGSSDNCHNPMTPMPLRDSVNICLDFSRKVATNSPRRAFFHHHHGPTPLPILHLPEVMRPARHAHGRPVTTDAIPLPPPSTRLPPGPPEPLAIRVRLNNHQPRVSHPRPPGGRPGVACPDALDTR